jgi:hypothetical protein
MRCSLTSASLSVTLILTLFLVLANFVYSETTFSDNPDEFVIYPPLSASSQQTETGGHGGRTANTTTPAEINCTQDWICDDWSSCASGFQIRDCADSHDCEELYAHGNVSKVITAKKPAESRDCKEIALPKVETPITQLQIEDAPVSQQKTEPQAYGNAAVKLAISPIVNAIALLVIAAILIKLSLRKKGDYIIVYLHRDKHDNNKFYIKKGYGNNFQSRKRQSRNNNLIQA